MKKVLFLALVAVLIPTLSFAGLDYVAGHRPSVISVFNTVHIDSTATDTSDWIPVGDCQHFTAFVYADSIGGAENVSVKVQYELSKDGVIAAIPLGESDPETFIEAFIGYSYKEYYKRLFTDPTIKMRFIRTGNAANGAYTYFSLDLVKQP